MKAEVRLSLRVMTWLPMSSAPRVMCCLALAVAIGAMRSPIAQDLLYSLDFELYSGAPLVSLPDFDGDGVMDFAVGGIFGGDPVSVVSGRRGIILRVMASGITSYLGTSLASAGDVDHDGVPDLVGGGPQSYRGDVAVWSGATGGLLWQRTGPAGSQAFGRAVSPVGDWNLDGTPDVAVGSDSGVHILSGGDGATVAVLPVPTLHWQWGVALLGEVDLDGDGRVDLVVASFQGPGNLRAVRGGNGAVLWSIDLSLPNTGLSDIVALASLGDLNGDCVPEIAAGVPGLTTPRGYQSGAVHVLSGASGALIWSAPGSSASEHFGVDVAAAGDIDGDSFPDVLAGGSEGFGQGAGLVRVLSGRDGSVIRTIPAPARAGGRGGFGASVLGGADLNGDGSTDFVVGAPFSPGPTAATVLVVSGARLSLRATTNVVSLGSGGSVPLSIDAGPTSASANYLVVGSWSGIAPGVAIGPHHLALNPDPLSVFLLGNMPQFLPRGNGQLDGEGRGTAALRVPAGMGYPLLGVTIDLAAIVFTVASTNLFVHLVTNTVPVTLGP